MKLLHTMVRVWDLQASLKFYCEGLGMQEVRRKEVADARFTLIFLQCENGPRLNAEGISNTTRPVAELELTYNWDQKEPYAVGRNFGHLAFEVDDIYKACQRLQNMGVTILRPPRDGKMAFVRSPDQISIELLQRRDIPLALIEPWLSMPNVGEW